MLLLLHSMLLYTVLSASNYIIDTPPGQLNDEVNGVVSWPYPMDICLPNQLVSRGITAYIKYECVQMTNSDGYKVVRHTYDATDTTCEGDTIEEEMKIFFKGTKGNPGYFVCGQEESEYAIINIYEDDTCKRDPIPLYSVIGTSDHLCFHDRNVYVSLFECFDDPNNNLNSLVNSHIKEAVFSDSECTNAIVGSTLTSTDCQIMGTINLGESNGGRTIIYGRHKSCHDIEHEIKKEDDGSFGNVLFGGNDNAENVKVITIGAVSSVVVYVGIIAFLFVNGCLCWCYLYINKDHR